MKRFLYSILILMIAASGCSRTDGDSRATITYQTIETLPQQRALLSQLIRKFEQQNPGIRVKVITSPNGFQKLHAQYAAGNVPDVFYYVSDRLFGFVRKKGIADLKPLIDGDPSVDLAKFFPETVDACRLDGGIYLMPVHFSTDVLFYNKDIFDKYGVPYPDENWTWADFLSAAQRLTVKEDIITTQYGTLQPRPVLVMKSFGAEFFDEGLTRPLFGGDGARESIAYLKTLSDREIVPSQAQIRDVEVMDGVSLFSTGKVAMLLGRTYMLVEFGSIKTFDWDVTLVPKGARRSSRLAVGGNCIYAGTKHPKEAWELVKFFSSEEALRTAGASRNCVPAMISVARSDVFMHEPPKHVAVFVDAIRDSAMENPRMEYWFEYVDKVIQLDVEKVIYNQMTVDGAVADIARNGEDILRKERREIEKWKANRDPKQGEMP
ncbi:MAG TPA: sugar ABC transporter substrate-binding protein [bacterium]|nr:sugar ABC transporter substrate-binding protein [bacterium]